MFFRCVAVEGSEMAIIGWHITNSGFTTTVTTGGRACGIGSITVNKDRTNLILVNDSLRELSNYFLLCNGIINYKCISF